jgi:hypothetical protein
MGALVGDGEHLRAAPEHGCAIVDQDAAAFGEIVETTDPMPPDLRHPSRSRRPPLVFV